MLFVIIINYFSERSFDVFIIMDGRGQRDNLLRLVPNLATMKCSCARAGKNKQASG